MVSGEKLSHNGSNEDNSPIQSTTYVDLDERRRASLAEIDNASFGYVDSTHNISLLLTPHYRWFHIKVCLVAGAGVFTDAYVVMEQTYLLLVHRW